MSNSKKQVQISEIRDKLTTLANKVSIKKWDMGATIGNDISVQIDKGKPKQMRASQKSSITIRVWNNEKIVGITSTSDLSTKGLSKALESALSASHFGNTMDPPDFSPQSKDLLPKLNRPIKESLGIKKLLNSLREAEKDLLNTHKAITSVPYNGFAESRFERVYINSAGALRHMESTQASLYMFARAQENGKKPRSSGSIKLAYGAEDIDINSCIKEASEKTISHLDYVPIKTGKYLICFKPEAFLDLITAFSNIYNARSVIDGISLSKKNSIGEKIASPIFNLNDDGLHEANFGACGFDGEGTPTQNIFLITSGVLTNFIHSEATARAFNCKPTGHAGIGSKVSVAPDWPVISKTATEAAEYPDLNHKETKDEFVMIENLQALHAGIKSSQGSFSLPFDGWLVKDGIKKSIEAATVAGDIKQVLNTIVQIESESHHTHQGVCPHIWIEELTVTGDT